MFSNLSFRNIDWFLFFLTLPIMTFGLLTMKSFSSIDGGVDFFSRQLIWIAISFIVFFSFSQIDFRFLRQTKVVVSLFLIFSGLLALLFVMGSFLKGAQRWFDLGGFLFQPTDLMKLVVIIVLAKYFSRRHVEIANIKHIFVSGLYAFIPLVLVLLQPDLDAAIIIFSIWLGMTMVSGIAKKHFIMIMFGALLTMTMMWFFVLKPYQKERIISFTNPLSDIQGTGYNAYQSTIAVGSGQILGKGLGYGTQSRLQFLPEFETDFIFAAFAEEWGFLGVLLLLLLFGLFIWRLFLIAMTGVSNFEILFGVGVIFLFCSHIFINIGMNLGLLPVTGTTLPLVSYGGSHLLTEFIALGILMGMRKYSRPIHLDDTKHEFLGI